MPRGIGFGIGKGIDGREAARQAVQQALENLGSARPAAAVVLAAQEYPLAEVMAGLGSLPGGLPLLGMSSSQLFTTEGDLSRAVIVLILAGPDWKVQPVWQPQYGRDSAAAGTELVQALHLYSSRWQGLLLSADGIQGEAAQVCAALTAVELPVAGGLATGDIQSGKTYQIGGSQWGSGALAALALGGRLRLGTGLAYGWKDTGMHFKVSRARNVWLQGLDGLSPAEAYARIFGTPAREWAFPPLTYLARLYPLGIELAPGQAGRIIRSPLQVDVDGSFRMNATLVEGEVAHLMVGDPQACLESAASAARQALAALGEARPVCALAFADQSWEYLFAAQPGQLSAALRAGLGEIPLAGAYTLGQITRLSEEPLVRFYNQGLLVAVIGEQIH
jgi:hypothetical protein